MISIYTLTANPALDLSGHVPQVVPNEKNYVHHSRLDPGGNGINAARIAKRLGADPVLLGFLGGAPGAQMRGLLDQERLRHRFTEIRAATRMNVTVTNDQDHEQTRLTFPGPSVRPAEVRSLLAACRKLKTPGIVVIGGSMPSGCPMLMYSQLIQIFARKGMGMIVDVPIPSLKTVWRSRAGKLLLIKPNQTEFEGLIGKKVSSESQVAREALKLLPRAEIVCVSLAEKGAVFAFRGTAWWVKAPKIRRRGSVGAGDSMVGTMCFELARRNLSTPELLHRADENEIVETVRWGVAAGAATAMTEGTTLGTAALIRRCFSNTGAQKLQPGLA